MKKKVVFICNNVTLAHPVRTILLASSLDRSLYDVVVYMNDAYQNLRPICLAPVKPISSMEPAVFLDRLGRLAPVFDCGTVENFIHDECKILEEERPDLVVGDFRVTLQISARKYRVPYLNITNAVWSSDSDVPYIVPRVKSLQWVPGLIPNFLVNTLPKLFFNPSIEPINSARKMHGLPALGSSIKAMYADADYSAYCDLPLFFDGYYQPFRRRFIGPVVWGIDAPIPDLGDIQTNGKYTIYINLGSSGNKNVLRSLCCELLKDDINLIVATGGSDDLNDMKDQPGFYTALYLPSDKMSKISDVTICNGGAPSAVTALLNGSYCIGLCTNMDQCMNMEAIRRRGYGIGFYNISSDIFRLVRLVGTRPRLNEAAFKKIEAEFSRYQPTTEFQKFIADILEERG